MHLLLSGEGSTDIGICNPSSEQCQGSQFKAGPMSWIVDQLVESCQGFEFSYLENDCASFVSESYLAANKPKPARKSMALRGKKRLPETSYYFNNARALAIVAKEKARAVNDTVVAVLFRDSDGTASSGRGEWRHKRDSMKKGFADEEYELGVPMMPKPKSEAWLLCAVKKNPYHACTGLENESGNDKGVNPLKRQLSKAVNGEDSTREINDRLSDKRIDVHRIDMPSFNTFKEELDYVVRKAMGAHREKWEVN